MTLNLKKYLDMIGAQDDIYYHGSYEEIMKQLDRHILEVNTFQAMDKEMWITPRPKTLCYHKKHQVKFRLLYSTENGEDVPIKFKYTIAYNLAYIIFVKKDMRTNFIDVKNKYGFSEKMLEFFNTAEDVNSKVNGKIHYILFDDDTSFTNQIDAVKAIGLYLLALGRRDALEEAKFKRSLANSLIDHDEHKANLNWNEAIDRERFVMKYDAIISPYLEKTKFIH